MMIAGNKNNLTFPENYVKPKENKGFSPCGINNWAEQRELLLFEWSQI